MLSGIFLVMKLQSDVCQQSGLYLVWEWAFHWTLAGGCYMVSYTLLYGVAWSGIVKSFTPKVGDTGGRQVGSGSISSHWGRVELGFVTYRRETDSSPSPLSPARHTLSCIWCWHCMCNAFTHCASSSTQLGYFSFIDQKQSMTKIALKKHDLVCLFSCQEELNRTHCPSLGILFRYH